MSRAGLAVMASKYDKNLFFGTLLPPQGFRPEAKSRGGTLVARAYIKDITYSTNMQSVYRKNLDLLEQGPRGIGR